MITIKKGLLQEERQPPRPLTLEQTPRSLPRLPPLPCRHLMVRLLPWLPGLRATPSFPVTTPSCRVTPTWPPPLWWLRLVRGCPRSLEVENNEVRELKRQSGTQHVKLSSSEKDVEDTACLPLHFVLVRALVCQLQKTDLSVKECHLILISHFRRAVRSNRIRDSHQIRGTPFSVCNMLHVQELYIYI